MSDNGKKAKSLEAVIAASVRKTTGGWAKQRKREEKDKTARYRRASYYQYSDRVTKKDAAFECMERVYNQVSDNGRLPAHARQLFYKARPIVEEEAKGHLTAQYFTQTLLPQYINEHPEAAGWRIAYDARGHFFEPHTDTEIGCGTVEIDNYLNKVQNHTIEDAIGDLKRWQLDTDYPTKGTKHRCSAILFIEKEGFHELFKEVKLAERYDLAILSTKGQSVIASRKLIDHLSDVPVCILHDFDAYGIRIAKNLVEVSDSAIAQNRVRYEFSGRINYIDFGLRLSDVEEWGLAAEGCAEPSIDDLRGDLTSAEYEFLSGGQRVELNAFNSAQLIKWIEAKLQAHGIGKVVPDDDTLRDAFRRTYVSQKVNAQLDSLIEEARKGSEGVEVPDDIVDDVEGRLSQSPETPWDEAVAEIVDEHIADSEGAADD